MRKLFFIFFFPIFFFSPQSASAANFTTDYNVSYSISDNAKTRVNFNVTLTNTTSEYYASSYSIRVGFKDVENVKASDPDGAIVPKLTKSENGANIDLNFNKRVVGLGNKLNFDLSFDTGEVAISNGSIWEVNIPGLSNQNEFSSFNVNVSYPSFLGGPVFIKPDPGGAISKVKGNTLTFSKGDLGAGGISIAFGEYQIYSFNLTYHLENKNLFPVRTEIALPPTTNYQDVSLTGLSPKPENVYMDADGNWLAQYVLSPSTSKQIQAIGKAKVYLKPHKRKNSEDVPSSYLSDKRYWETNDPKIKSLANELKTPRAIYDYVVDNLNYDFSRVVSGKPRLGASNILQNTQSAVCLEFSDLFVTLSRAAGIPAREIDGFANTKNTRERPLSLVKDVLHAWPEYYDRNTENWIMIDPTWGNTTNGIDYFNTLDFDHFAFVIKGKDSSYPIPAGGYKREQDLSVKDVDVNISGSYEEKPNLEVMVFLPNESLPWTRVSGYARVKNTGNTISDKETLHITSGFIKPNKNNITVNSLPPYGYIDVPINFESSSFLTKKSDIITIQLGKNIYQKRILISPFSARGFALGGIFLVTVITLSFVAFKSRRLFLRRQFG